MRLTIVTPSLNQGEFIKDTFDSILAQNLPPGYLEYILVDALSTDHTDEIVRTYRARFEKAGIRFIYIREKDKGQSDAINKGWMRATGDIVSYINSDDFYETGVLEKILDYFQTHARTQWAYGGWHLVNRRGNIYTSVVPNSFLKEKLLDYCNIGQPSCFFRKKLLKEFGYLNDSLHLAFDYDLWLKFSTRYEAGIIPGILSSMRYYACAKSATKTKEQLGEILCLSLQYTQPISIQRVRQYFFFIRGWMIAGFKMDVTRRIEKAHLYPRNHKKIIALVDPILIGHHDMYLRLYSETLLHLGYDVWIFTVHPQVFRTMKSVKIYSLATSDIFSVHISIITLFIELIRTTYYWLELKRAMNNAVQRSGNKPDLVFITWLDSYLHPFLPAKLVDIFFPYAWSGLYFHPRHLRIPLRGFKAALIDPDRILRCQRCLAVAVLDEGIVQKLSYRVQKPIIAFPDVTGISLPNTTSTVLREIIDKANNRKIIGIFGSIEKRKCALEFMDISRTNDGGKYFFLFTGPVHLHTYSGIQRTIVKKFIANPPENSYVIPNYMPSEKMINSLINTSDIISVLYHDFPHSSNLLTKAAYFRIPVIASSTFCIGERVTRYHLGEVVRHTDNDSIIKTIKTILYKANRGYYSKQYPVYEHIASMKMLTTRFEQMLSSIL